MGWSFQSATPALGSIHRKSIGFLTPTTRRSLTAWAWAYRSAGRSSRRTAGGYGRPRTTAVAQPFTWLCRPSSHVFHEGGRTHYVRIRRGSVGAPAPGELDKVGRLA